MQTMGRASEREFSRWKDNGSEEDSPIFFAAAKALQAGLLINFVSHHVTPRFPLGKDLTARAVKIGEGGHRAIHGSVYRG